jgi:ABC-2 type transport system permease protein
MRLISEEKRTGTFEMLVTTPARDHEIVLAKFAAAWMFNAAMWLIIPLYALVASKSGGDPDMGPVWVSYLSVVATGALYLSIGLMASAVTRHQILAAFLAFVLLFLLGLAPSMWNQLPESWDTIRTVLRKGDILLQMEQAARGLLDVVHLTYKLAFAGLFLLFTTRILELRKWA